MSTNRSEGLLRWQWSGYAAAHMSRGNLVLHAVTAPLFIAGTVASIAGLVMLSPAIAASGAAAMLATVAVQGAGHKREQSRPAPFTGPLDFVLRFFAEQWVTFPRYVATGSFARAWRAAGARGRARTA